MTACIILNYNDSSNTLKLLQMIKDYETLDLILLVDNCSTDDSWEKLQKVQCDKVHICKTEKNGGYGYGNNYGIKYAQKCGCDLALIANPDVSFDNRFVETLKIVLEQYTEYSVASGIQRDIYNKEITRSAWRIPRIWNYIFSTGILLRKFGENFYYTLEQLHSKDIFPVECVAGSLLMVSIAKFIECGGFDEEMFLYCEESTLGYKMNEIGYKAAICSTIAYQHIHGLSIHKSISSDVKKKRILLNSHHIFLSKYLNANKLQLAVDSIVGKIVLLEEVLIGICNRKRKEKC